MAAAIGLREDFDATALRALAKRAKDGPQARRLLALAAIYDGAPRGEAAKIGGVTLQIVRDWVMQLQRVGPGRSRRSQGAGAAVAPQRGSARCAGAHGRGAARRPRSTASCVGASSTSASGCSRTFRVCVSETDDEPGTAQRWAIASFRRARAIMRRRVGAIEDFKKVSRPAWRKSRAKKASSRTR